MTSAVSELWDETAKLQAQIQSNFETTSALLQRAAQLKERIITQRQNNRQTLSLLVGDPEDGDASTLFGLCLQGRRFAPPFGGWVLVHSKPLVLRAREEGGGKYLTHTLRRPRADSASLYADVIKDRDAWIAQLEEDNQTLRESLQEYENTLELIMEKQRTNLRVLQNESQAAINGLTAELDAERARNRELEAKNVALESRVYEMINVMRMAADADEADMLEEEVRSNHVAVDRNRGCVGGWFLGFVLFCFVCFSCFFFLLLLLLFLVVGGVLAFAVTPNLVPSVLFAFMVSF